MKLKTFQAKTMAEALEQVKRKLGRDAVILHTRTFTTGGLFGWGGKPMVEITAARSVSDLPHYAGGGRLSNGSRHKQAKADGAASPMVPSAGASPAAQPTALSVEVHSLLRHLLNHKTPQNIY